METYFAYRKIEKRKNAFYKGWEYVLIKSKDGKVIFAVDPVTTSVMYEKNVQHITINDVKCKLEWPQKK